MHESIVFAGFGGQGVMFVGQLLSYAAMDAGYYVTWIPSYGPEMRGGTANCFVVISDRPIGSPLVRQPGLVLVFNQPSMDKFAPLVASGGLLVVNGSLIKETVPREEHDIDVLVLPATEIASGLGSLQLTNVVLLGALLTARPLLPLNAVERALESHLPVRHHDLLGANIQALERGSAFAVAKANG